MFLCQGTTLELAEKLVRTTISAGFVTRAWLGVPSGSRAVMATKQLRALSPAGFLSPNSTLESTFSASCLVVPQRVNKNAAFAGRAETRSGGRRGFQPPHKTNKIGPALAAEELAPPVSRHCCSNFRTQSWSEDAAHTAAVKCAIAAQRSILNIPNPKFPAKFCR